ncbi:M56 family metallopeptidase [Ornithinibacillus gellani]|uniref:M56 family metallopeptidase n=1 Tax=Ornithinibacillus gellani TaxID=2293253 RepID=UPI000F49FBF0|nr:M56 family metallopeptidase [Ornithinibacillus gellani]TQS71855.1 M56 family metallopeptidase [Ornithinibacillus gellani]
MSKRQSSFVLIGSLAISGTILLQMGLYVISLLSGWNMKFNLVEICHSWLGAIGLSSLEYVLDGLVIFTPLCAIWIIGSQIVQSSKLERRFRLYEDKKLTDEITKLYGKKDQEQIIVLSHPAPIAITMGLICPKIILSTGLINLLTKDELKAVISHEMYHKKNRDPFKLFLLSLSSSILWYIPIQKWFHRTYQIIQEILADEYAIKQQDTTVNLGSALLKMLKVGKLKKMPFTYASFADTSVNYRIKYMLHPVKEVPLGIPFRVVFISLTVFSLICGLFIYVLV